MVYTLLAPRVTVEIPDGEIVPFAPVVAVIVYVGVTTITLKVAAIVWFEVIFAKV